MGLSPSGLHPSPALPGDCYAAPRRWAAPKKTNELIGLATASPSRGEGGALWCASQRTAGRAVALKTVFLAESLSWIALQSRPSLLSRSPAAALDRPCGPAWCRARWLDCAISSPSAPVMLAQALRAAHLSRLHAPCRNPAGALRGAPSAAIHEAAPKSRFIQERRRTMASKTISTTTYDAGTSPAPREAHQRAGGAMKEGHS